MPTDKEVKNLVFNVLTEEQYESATKNEDEFYLTPDNSVEIEKVIPTDVAIKDNKLGLKHNSVWLTNQNAINLGEGLTYDEATKTLKAGGIPPLPADASNATYVLKAVNGAVQWVKEA